MSAELRYTWSTSEGRTHTHVRAPDVSGAPRKEDLSHPLRLMRLGVERVFPILKKEAFQSASERGGLSANGARSLRLWHSAGGRFGARIKVGPGTSLLQRNLQPPSQQPRTRPRTPTHRNSASTLLSLYTACEWIGCASGVCEVFTSVTNFIPTDKLDRSIL